MSEQTNIQWTNHTFSAWYGCRKVAPECVNCYITRQPPLRMRHMKHGGERVRASDNTFRQPLEWNRKAAKDGIRWGVEHSGGMVQGLGFTSPPPRPRVFSASLSDWLDDENVPAEWTCDLLGLINDTPHLDWLLLTKRPQNFNARLEAAWKTQRSAMDMIVRWRRGEPPPNVWIGVSAGADQAAALSIPAKIHFLSCEPMLKEMDTTHAAKFNWIILGGESGPNARQCGLGWIRDAKVFCEQHSVPCFVKQLGSNIASGGSLPRKLKHSHGGDMSEWPEDLRVREFPTL